eukprot:6112258-Pleurochrysis_carterae.AAC.1
MLIRTLRRRRRLSPVLDLLSEPFLLRQGCIRWGTPTCARPGKHHGISQRALFTSPRTRTGEPARRAHGYALARRARRRSR